MPILYDGAEYRPLGPQTEPRLITHDILCYHTMVGYLVGTDGYFRRGNGEGYNGTESHVGLGGPWDAQGQYDGVMWQWQDLAYRADANLNGNWHIVSVEMSDGGDPSRPLTPKMIEEAAQFGAFICNKFDIPPVLIPDTKVGRRGIGYHRQGIDPWRVPDGERWSSANGKVCPGDVRIAQLKNAVIPRIVEILRGDDDMNPEQFKLLTDKLTKLEKGITQIIQGDFPIPKTGQTHPANLKDMFNMQDTLLKNDAAQTAALQTMTAQVGGLMALAMKDHDLSPEQAMQIATEAARRAVEEIHVPTPENAS